METLVESLVLMCRPSPRTGPCGKPETTEMATHALSQKKQGMPTVEIKVTVEAQPFGMNIKTDDVPCVVHVAAGSSAEIAGVRVGDVLTAVNGIPVTAEDWYEAYSTATVPIIVTLETCPRATASSDSAGEKTSQFANARSALTNAAATSQNESTADHIEFHCSVSSLPFGLRMRDTGDRKACVLLVVESSPAEVAGVRMGDILISVGSLNVTADSWQSTLADSELPCRLIFHRPRQTPLPSPVKGVGLATLSSPSDLPFMQSSRSASPDALHRELCIGSSLADENDAAASILKAVASAAKHEAAITQRPQKPGPDQDSTSAIVESNRAAVGDLDAFADEAAQEQQTALEVQDAQAARRQKGLEMRQLQLQQAEDECALAQQATSECLAKLDPASQAGKGLQDPELAVLLQSLSLKKRRREALLHDIAMWESWMKEADNLVAEHHAPFSTASSPIELHM